MPRWLRTVMVALLVTFVTPSAAAVATHPEEGGSACWPPPWGATPAAGQAVLLVAGPGNDPEYAWGGPGGLRARLEEAGYRVWVVDLSREEDPDPERLARLRVAPVAERALAASPSPRLHVVAHGLGALVARYWVEFAGPERVGSLIMLAPPNHGSFAMNLLHLAAALTAREAGVLERSAGRADGSLWDYVWEKAGVVYQPLYRRYVREYRLGVPPRDFLSGVRQMMGRLPFEGWVAREEPQLFAREFREAQQPLPGTSVTAAYSHALALNVGRAEELRAALRGPGLAVSLLEDPLLSTDWREMARHYGRRAVLWAGRRLADWLTRQGQKLLLDQAPALLGVDPFSPGMERVLEEYFFLPLGPGPDGRPKYECLLGNCFLKDWNESATRAETARYVVVAGRVPNLWCVGWKQVGENDFWVQVDSCFLPPGPDDRFVMVEDRGISASHGRLPRNRRVGEIVLSELGFDAQRVLYPRAGPPCQTVSWTSRGEIPLSRWRPRYLRIDSRYLTCGGDLALELEARASTRSGMPPAWVWVEGAGGGWERREVPWQEGRGSMTIPRFGQEVTAVVLGGRLGEVPPRGLAGSYRLREQGELSCSVTFTPSPGGDGRAAEEARLPGEGRDGGGIAAGNPPGAVPVIRAVLPTRQTTHRKERRTYHTRWEWDFGDGTTFVDDDPAHTAVTVTHVFPVPGEYAVRARSCANDGRVLREQVWRVTVTPADGGHGGSGPPPGEESTVEAGRAWRASLETAREPKVTVTIDSPKEWMAGRPARIRVSVQAEDVPGVVERRIAIDPGPEFVMVWDRAGLFPVRVAVTLTLRYRFPETEYTLRNTYLFEEWVNVLTTAGTE